MTTSLHLEKIKPSPEIESLGRLASQEEIRGELGRVASNFGKITTVMPLPKRGEEEGNRCGFLVCFEQTMDALAASRHWRCVLFGFTTVVVFINSVGGPPEVH